MLKKTTLTVPVHVCHGGACVEGKVDDPQPSLAAARGEEQRHLDVDAVFFRQLVVVLDLACQWQKRLVKR